MPMIPAELLVALESLGIRNPVEAKWSRREEWPLKYMRAHYFCPCGNREHEQKVDLVYTVLGNRRIFIGQCRWCQVVYWRDAVSGG